MRFLRKISLMHFYSTLLFNCSIFSNFGLKLYIIYKKKESICQNYYSDKFFDDIWTIDLIFQE